MLLVLSNGLPPSYFFIESLLICSVNKSKERLMINETSQSHLVVT